MSGERDQLTLGIASEAALRRRGPKILYARFGFPSVRDNH
jgi:hypothetical protein